VKVKKRKDREKRWKGIVAKRAKVAWTRDEFVNELEGVLGAAFALFARWKLTVMNGPKGLVYGLEAEFERGMTLDDVFGHPMKRNFDRRAGFEQVVAGMESVIERACANAEQEFETVCGSVRRGLGAADVEAFWARVQRDAKNALG
jgi:hypothetical protein